MTDKPPYTVELMKPLLPLARDIHPYIERIDTARWYSNSGPLVRDFSARLATHFGLEAEEVITCSNATVGMTSMLQALQPVAGSYCLMPSWTFVATPASAIAAGMVPYFLDVDAERWALDPVYTKAALSQIKGDIGAVIPVAPYGKRIDLAAWERFSKETGIPVVVDAAAGFDSFTGAAFNSVPVVFSLHATKVLGVGEGGFIICRDKALAERVRQQTNFGFDTNRSITLPGLNTKMSEYVAAIGLAALDVWPERRRQWSALIKRYLELFSPIAAEYGLTLWLEEDVVTSTCSIRLPQDRADEVIAVLQARGIMARQWWDKGCHRQPAYSGYPRLDVPVTQSIGDSVVALPFYADIPDEQVVYLANTLSEILRK